MYNTFSRSYNNEDIAILILLILSKTYKISYALNDAYKEAKRCNINHKIPLNIFHRRIYKIGNLLVQAVVWFNSYQ